MSSRNLFQMQTQVAQPVKLFRGKKLKQSIHLMTFKARVQMKRKGGQENCLPAVAAEKTRRKG